MKEADIRLSQKTEVDDFRVKENEFKVKVTDFEAEIQRKNVMIEKMF